MSGRIQPRPSSILALLAVVAIALSPAILTGPQQSLITRALIFALLAASLDIAYGHAGLASLGHAAIAGVGGYTAGLLMVEHDVDSFWIGAGAAIVASSIAAALMALLALRARGLYFILATFALGQMLANLAQQWDALKTSYAEAVVGISLPTLGFGLGEDWSTAGFLRFVLAVVTVALFGIHRVLGSAFGLAIRGVRDNGTRMEALGYHAWAYRVAALVVSGAFAGLAGALFAYHGGIMTPSNIGISASGLLVLMVIFGGSGTTYGPAIGGFVITLIQFYASEWSELRSPLILGGVFIVTALFIRGGLAGTIARLRARPARRAEPRAQEATS